MNHEQYMERCISLARNARGNTSPNPLVGAVIVHQHRIIGEGWHHKAGAPHAEVNAIRSVTDKSLLKESTIYVSLEPCAHFGKTPPCSDLIIEKQIPRVVIGCRDPFTEVNGRGIEKLKSAGVQLTEGILENKCRELNAPFFTFHTKKRPYTILKWAQTRDGFMDKKRDRSDKGVNWITQSETRVLVHQWRADVDAILVGHNTVLHDNPGLTTREVAGKNPIRLIIDPKASLKGSLKIFDSEAPTFILVGKDFNTIDESLHQRLDMNNPVASVMEFCYKQGIQSLLVEGGAQTLNTFIKSELWDEARVFTGVTAFGDGLPAPEIQAHLIKTLHYGKDTLNIYRP